MWNPAPNLVNRRAYAIVCSVVRSVHTAFRIQCGLLAQLAEQRPFKPRVQGSSPWELTSP